MGKIYYIMGKSSSGKDTLYKELLQRLPELKPLILYTTRPMREGERNGVEYFLCRRKCWAGMVQKEKLLRKEHMTLYMDSGNMLQ